MRGALVPFLHIYGQGQFCLRFAHKSDSPPPSPVGFYNKYLSFSSTLGVICVVPLLLVLFYVLFVCKCVLYYCHRVASQLQLTNVSYHIIINTLRTGSFKLFKRPFPGFLTILTL